MANVLTFPKILSAKPSFFGKELSKTKGRRNLPFLNLFAIGAVNILALAFLIFQFNLLVKETYQIQGYQKEISDYSRENNILEIKLSKINSLENINLAVSRLGMEKTGRVYYLKASDSQMAKR